MSKPNVALFLLAAFATLLPGRHAMAGDARVEVKTFQQRYFLGDAERVKVDLSLGRLTVEGSGGRDVEVELRVECSRQDLERCREHAERMGIVTRVRGDLFVLHLDRTPRGRIQGLEASMTVKLPHDVPLDVDIRAGDVFVTGMRSDIEIGGVAGDVDVVAQRKDVGTVKTDVGIGKNELWLSDGHIEGTGLSRSVKWQGPGAASVKVNIGTGDIRVRLE